jgi:hypothetical protein
MLRYDPGRVVHPADIPLPAPRQIHGTTTADASIPRPSTSTAPVEAPSSISPEAGRDEVAPSAPTGWSAIERGVGGSGVDGVGMAEALPQVPPARRPPVRMHQGIQAPVKIVDVAPIKTPGWRREAP